MQSLGSGVKTWVPENYSLSFDITPAAVLNNWGGIIHYMKDVGSLDTSSSMPGKCDGNEII
jgi:hypothetical protein